MITLFIMGLAGAGMLFAGLPVLVFSLMLETCAERADGNERFTACSTGPR
jgi:hypothetical protein